jgi:hypothetical protein
VTLINLWLYTGYLGIVSWLVLLILTAFAVNAVWSVACFIHGLRQAGKFDPNLYQAENQS